jgi:hypothetical protein
MVDAVLDLVGPIMRNYRKSQGKRLKLTYDFFLKTTSFLSDFMGLLGKKTLK